jgi:NitT/TauT family transport system substrate-binding protein
MITPEDKIADIIEKYPFVKDKLIERNRVFRNLNNPVVFNTVGKFARITDIAKVSGENIDELIHFINELVEDSDK